MGFWQFTGIAGMVSLAFLSFYLNENDIFPGLHALVVTIASALVILSGVSKTSIVSYILSLRPMAFIGRLFYSLYLCDLSPKIKTMTSMRFPIH